LDDYCERTVEAFDHDLMWREEKPFADRLAMWIKNNLKPQRVVDIGCGPGMYVAALREVGVSNTHGYDLDSRVDNRESEGLHRLSMFDLDDPADVVLCLEVAEHIPAMYEGEVASAVARNTMPGGTLIWSAALPGQGGIGHVNCQPKEHWEVLLSQAGMRRNLRCEEDLLSDIRAGYHMGWFSMNAMLFVRGIAPRPTE
jgi:SAM-dependent methyltransferase